MTLKLDIIDPTTHARWNELLLAQGTYSFFHTSHWARVLNASYGYTPLYFTIMRNDALAALIPVMEINSYLTGKRAVSLPFTDYCERTMEDNNLFEKLADALIEYGKKTKWKSIELRTVAALPSQYLPSSIYYGHSLDLARSEEDLYKNLRDSTRRNIKKAEKEGVEVTISNSIGSLDEFCRLNYSTRRDHGLPPQPDIFFKNIHEYILSKGFGYIALAKHQGKHIAGAMYFHFGDQAFYKYGASDKRFQHMRANNLIMWEAILRYCKTGLKKFSFGRTESDNSGLLQFKSGWGAREYPITYYKYDLRRDTFTKDSLKVKGLHNHLFRRMPISLLKLAGSLLYRHIG